MDLDRLGCTTNSSKKEVAMWHNTSKICSVVLIFVLAASVQPVHAQSAPTVINFDNLSSLTVVTDQYSNLGVTFSGAVILTCGESLLCDPISEIQPIPPFFPPFSFPNVISTIVGGRFIFASFTGNVTTVSARVSNIGDLTMTAFDRSGNVLATTQTDGVHVLGDANFLLTVQSAGQPIGGVTFLGFAYTVDDFTFSGGSGGCQTNVTPLSQGNPQWAANLYDHSGSLTIQQKGCGLTSLSMALNAAGIVNNPGGLNQFMTQTDTDYKGLEVNWGPATRDASGGTLKLHARRISSLTDSASAMQYLDDTICRQAHPVIVGVNLNAKGIPEHFVVVTGKQENDFQIADPGFSNTKLSQYNNKFETRGFVADPPGDISELDLAVGDIGEILVIDQSGRKTGFDPLTGHIIEQIPNSVYFRDALQDDITGALPNEVSHFVEISQPLPGEYQILVNGLKLGTYSLSSRMFSQDGSSQPEVLITGIAGAGSSSPFSIQVNSTPGAKSTVVAAATFPSTLADIDNSLSLGLIDNQGIANSLSQKIQAAQKNSQPARNNELNAFINEVKAQAGKHISDSAVQVLLQDANSLLTQ